MRKIWIALIAIFLVVVVIPVAVMFAIFQFILTMRLDNSGNPKPGSIGLPY